MPSIVAQALEEACTKVVCEPAAPVNCPVCSSPHCGFAWRAFLLGLIGLCLWQVDCYCCYVLGSVVTTGSWWWSRSGPFDPRLPSRLAWR